MARTTAERTALRLGLPALALGLVAALMAPPASAAPNKAPDETAILMNFTINSATYDFCEI